VIRVASPTARGRFRSTPPNDAERRTTPAVDSGTEPCDGDPDAAVRSSEHEAKTAWPEAGAALAELNRFTERVDDKAWQHLGITGEEFRQLWYAGAFKLDAEPAVLALDRLMRTGEWDLQ
jgi:hypothetical protein